MTTIGNTQSRLWAEIREEFTDKPAFVHGLETNPPHGLRQHRTLNRAEARDKGAMYISNLEESTWRAPGYK